MTIPTIPELLAELVRRPSLNPMGRTDIDPGLIYEHRVTDYVEGLLRPLGVPIVRDTVAPGRDNLIATWTPPHATRTILLEVHQDTVPVDGMTIDPFAAAIRDGRLYGRGACDVKAGMAAMLTAFARLACQNPAGRSAVMLALTVDEESTFLGVQRLAEWLLERPLPSFAIVAEPTRLKIVTAHKGVTRFSLRTTGRSCHSSRPTEGENAIYHMARLLPLTEAYGHELSASRIDPVLGPATLSVGRIRGGVSVNTVPDFCEAEIDRRLLPGETSLSASGEFRQYLGQHAPPHVPYEVTATWQYCPGLSPERSGEVVGELGQAIREVTGRGFEIEAVPYGTDASTLALAEIPAVVFGPGDIAQAHTKDEWVDLAEVQTAAEILYRLAVG